jgi:hypothetical protein
MQYKVAIRYIKAFLCKRRGFPMQINYVPVAAQSFAADTQPPFRDIQTGQLPMGKLFCSVVRNCPHAAPEIKHLLSAFKG